MTLFPKECRKRSAPDADRKQRGEGGGEKGRKRVKLLLGRKKEEKEGEEEEREKRERNRRIGASQNVGRGLRQRQTVGRDVIWDSPEANYRE